jgi:hypothetical protein
VIQHCDVVVGVLPMKGMGKHRKMIESIEEELT